MQPPNHVGYWISRALRAAGAVASEALRARCVELGKPYVVTPPQWGVLTILAANGELTVSALSQIVAVEGPGVTGLLTRLEQNGLVERVHDWDDRRVVNVSLTAEGRRIVRALNPVMAKINAQLVPPDETPAFVGQLQALIARAAALAPDKSGPASALPPAVDLQNSKEL